jgi:hypothetical protein
MIISHFERYSSYSNSPVNEANFPEPNQSELRSRQESQLHLRNTGVQM